MNNAVYINGVKIALQKLLEGKIEENSKLSSWLKKKNNLEVLAWQKSLTFVINAVSL